MATGVSYKLEERGAYRQTKCSSEAVTYGGLEMEADARAVLHVTETCASIERETDEN